MAKFKNPYLSEEGLDFATGQRHCAGCERSVAGIDFYAGYWKHFILQTTVEVDREPRTLMARLYGDNCLAYCTDCFPKTFPTGCRGCGQPVDLEKDHTESEHLLCEANGLNSQFNQGVWHIACLPEAFQLIKGQGLR